MALSAAAANRHSAREQSQWHAGGFHEGCTTWATSAANTELDMNTGSAERCLTYEERYLTYDRAPTGRHVWWYGVGIFTFEGSKVRDLCVLGDV